MSDTSSDTSAANTSPNVKAANAIASANNADRLEKKKNREKRRRSEVNDRFDELIEVMENAQSQMLNAPPFCSEFSKGVLTKAGLLEKAVDLVKLLADENKKLRMMIQPTTQQPPMMTPFDPQLAQNWMATCAMPGFNGPAALHPSNLGKMAELPQFARQPPQQLMFSHPPNSMLQSNYNGCKPSILSASEMMQLGDWSQSAQIQFQHGSGMKAMAQVTSNAMVNGPTTISTHAECA